MAATRARHRSHRWTEAALKTLAWYAERGLSEAETACLMGRTKASIALKAGQLRIHFHGPSGAPFCNQNGNSPARRLEQMKAQVRRSVLAIMEAAD